MKTVIQLGIVMFSSILGVYAVIVWARNGSLATHVGSDVYYGMFVAPAVLLGIALVTHFGKNREFHRLAIGSLAIPTIVLAGWMLLASTNQVITHSELMNRERS